MSTLNPTRRAALLTAAIVMAACSSEADDAASASASATTSSTVSGTATTVSTVAGTATTDVTTEPPDVDPVDLGRLVVLGEEFLLADVLALGGRPIASTATLEGEFSGIRRETGGIQPLSSTEANFELLASLEPDLILVTSGVIDLVGVELFEGIAPTTVIDSSDWRVQVEELGAAMGVPERADELLARYDNAVAAAEVDVPADVEITLATVYTGPSLAVWADGPVNIPQTLLDLGITLSPGGGELDGERNGRAFISNELIPLLDGDLLILAQSSGVEGEDASVAEIASEPLWQTLPAVQNDAVLTIDRLGYPGVEGRIRLIEDVVAAIDAGS
ncbi:MAG: ABC transporter substrate-binding protein [Actinomycetota bacterium]